MRTWMTVVAAVGIAACSSTVDGPASGGCADITGNYEVTETVTSTTCPPSGDAADSKVHVTISKTPDGLSLFWPNVTGGCPGTLDPASCRFQAQCEVTQNGAVAITYNADFTFSGTKFSGSMVGGAAAGIAGPNACTISETDQGTRL